MLTSFAEIIPHLIIYIRAHEKKKTTWESHFLLSTNKENDAKVMLSLNEMTGKTVNGKTNARFYINLFCQARIND